MSMTTDLARPRQADRIAAGESRMTTEPGNQTVHVIGQPVTWWTGVWGLDPAYATQNVAFGASTASIVCAAHALGVEQPRGRFRGKDERIEEAGEWFKWLAEAVDPADGAVRRLALRAVCDDPSIDPLNILSTAKALHRACTP